jgi:hypothetical protein
MQFHTTDGQHLKNLIDLTFYLKGCGEEPFDYHVSREHNHFSNWVDNNVLDRDLANQMSLVLDKNPMRIIVAKRINFLVHSATRTPRGRDKARMILENAQLPEELFTANDGRVIRNLWELKEFLNSASDHTISYHISPGKNDIHNWVAEILMDYELADLIFGAKDRVEVAGHIADRLSYLEGFKVHQENEKKLASYVDRIMESSKKFQ